MFPRQTIGEAGVNDTPITSLDTYRLLGRSGLRVSPLCLGTMTFGTDWGWGADNDTSKVIFEAYANRGGNFIDTANFYTNGTSEKLVGELIASERDRFVLATKYTMNMRPGDPNAGGNHRKNMVRSVEDSLRRLGTDYIDLYWLHAWDSTTPVDEVMRALDDLVRAGKILHVGASNAPAWKIAQANTLSELMGWTRFVAMQVEYSLAVRDVERELLPMARELDIAVLPWSPLAGNSDRQVLASGSAEANGRRSPALVRSGKPRVAAHRTETESRQRGKVGGGGDRPRARASRSQLAVHPRGRGEPDTGREKTRAVRGQSRRFGVHP